MYLSPIPHLGRAMFWKYNTAGVSQIDTILEKQDLTLKEVQDYGVPYGEHLVVPGYDLG